MNDTRRWLVTVPALFLASTCSFINAGFEECTTDTQCGASKVCLDRFCLPMPAQCRRETGAFDKPNPIRLAALLPLSAGVDGGAIDASEVAGLNAMDLAVDDVNGSGGVDNRLFALYVCNTGRIASILDAQATWMIKQAGVPAIITSGSGQTLTAAENVARTAAGTLIVSPTSTSEELIGTFRRDGATWRIAPPDTLQVPVMVRTLLSETEYSSAPAFAVLYEDTPYGRGIASGVREQLVARGKRSEIKGYNPGMFDVSRVVTDLSSFYAAGPPPRATVFVGFPDQIIPVIETTRSNSTLSYASGHRWFFADAAKDPAIIKPTTLPQIVDALGTTPAQGAGTAYADFRSRYRDRFQLDPNDFSFTSHSYDAAYLVMLGAAYALRDRGALTGPRMSEALTKVSVTSGTVYRVSPMAWKNASSALATGMPVNLEGTSGGLDFDLDAGAPSAPYEVWQITDGGTFSTLRTVNP